MKKLSRFSVSIICMILAIQTTFSQTEYQLDSIQKFDSNIITTAFEMTDREHYTYANGGTKETFGISYKYNGFVWNENIRYDKTYNEFNKIIDKIFETYDPVFTTWYLGNRTLFTYDSSQNIIVMEDFSSSDGGLTWANPLNAFEFTYNSDNLIITEIELFYNFIQMGLVNLNQKLSTYSGLLKVEEILQTWNNSGSVWDNSEKTDFTYNGDLLIQEDIYFWMGSDWTTQAFKRYLNSYSNDILTEKVTQEWNNGSSTWENTERIIWTFDTNENIQEILISTWDTNISDWINEKQELWYWSEAGAILGVKEENKLSVNIYPNPTSEFFTIDNLKENAIIALFDIRGKRVMNYSFANVQNPRIYTNQFSNGIYFLKIASDTGTVSKKLIIK